MIRIFLLMLLLFGSMTFAVSSQMDDMDTMPPADSVYVYHVWAIPTADDGSEGTLTLNVENAGEMPIAPLGFDIAGIAQFADIDERGRAPVIEPGDTATVAVELSGMGEPLTPQTALPFMIGFIALDADGNAEGDPLSVDSAALVVEEAPVFPADIVIANLRVRATVSAEMAASMGEMDMGDDMAAGIPPSAAYMTLLYRDNAAADSDDEPFADSLIAAETAAAGVVEIHTTEIDGDVMRMRQIDGIDITPDAPSVLRPGGDHVMLMQLPADLLPGDAITLTLIFESGLEVTVAAPVLEIPTMMNMGDDMHGDMDTESDE